MPALPFRLLLRIGHADRPIAGVVRGVPADAVGIAERELVARRVERGRGDVAQRAQRIDAGKPLLTKQALTPKTLC